MGEQEISPGAFDPDVVLGGSGQVQFGTVDIVLGVRLDPGMIDGRVIRHEVEHQPEATLPQAPAQLGQRLVASQAGIDGVAGDREPGAGDVVVGQVGQGVQEFPAPLRVGARHLPPGRAGLPDAQQPHPVEPQVGHPVERAVGDVGQGGRAPEGARHFAQPDPGIDLVEGGIQRVAHLSRCAPGRRAGSCRSRPASRPRARRPPCPARVPARAWSSRTDA